MAFVGCKQPGPIEIAEDNTGCLKWTESLGHHSKRKHIDLASYNAYDSVDNGTCKFIPVKSGDNVADAFTKVLPSAEECKRQYQQFTTYRKARHFTNIS